ncbi:glycosyltransferase family 25 [Hirsutella rhossiliensis]|uniref:Glycosyltransferase family 25 n=1 Tax=Hirsutella rhossiliensis TaxID=111463 RepID=A0A9P8SG23_9HYPO|nr:glycosyltransferase family 25 [Hirsutella rhossiliensis]KAH0960005.1 glycosyltransferase family 25 [Hirsutella rhossiliensis]
MHITRNWSLRLALKGGLAIIALRVIIAYLSTDALSLISQAANISTIRHARPVHAPSHLPRTANRTLGFERVIAISLPERSDKRDALDLMASLTEFDIDWEDGVKASSIAEKAVPYGISLDRAKENFLGSWRGHMNIIRRIVETGISSALILEDDVDWDVHLKSQLSNIAQGTRHVLGESASSFPPDSPYGDGWDVLWLGHCGEYAIQDDETMPSYSRVTQWVDWGAFPPHTRLVHLSGLPVCSFAYAVSQKAAKKILYALSIDGLHTEFDNALAALCRDGRSDASYHLKCLSVNPTIIFHHKPKGRLTGDSDINSQGEDGGERQEGFTESIKWSMRLNLKNILLGRPLEQQFDD